MSRRSGGPDAKVASVACRARRYLMDVLVFRKQKYLSWRRRRLIPARHCQGTVIIGKISPAEPLLQQTKFKPTAWKDDGWAIPPRRQTEIWLIINYNRGLEYVLLYTCKRPPGLAASLPCHWANCQKGGCTLKEFLGWPLVPIFPSWPASAALSGTLALCKTPAYPTLTFNVSQFPPAPHSWPLPFQSTRLCVNPPKVEPPTSTTLAPTLALACGFSQQHNALPPRTAVPRRPKPARRLLRKTAPESNLQRNSWQPRRSPQL